MTIDEAINILKSDNDYNKSIGCDTSYEEQLAEWLELLKWYEQGMEDIPSESGVLPKDVYHAGYNKALDDFKKILTIEKIKEYAESDGYINLNNCSLMIFDIAEQLKAG